MPRVTRQQRGQLWRTILLGLAITLLVTSLDVSGYLRALEDWFYDRRARHLQFFTPPPTDRLVHLDIDDAALNSIGRWPWPRSVLAEVIDELRRCSADVVALDIITPEKQQPTLVRAGAQITQVDHDAILAQTLRDHGRVLVPVSFVFERSRYESAMARAIAAELRQDLTLTFDALQQRIGRQFPQLTSVDMLEMRRQVVAEALERQMLRQPGELEEIRQRLLGEAPPGMVEPELLKEIEVQFAQYLSKHHITRFGKLLRRPVPNILLPADQHLMIPELAAAAAYTGFVDHLPYGDGVERAVPLWVSYRGRAYPQLGLALACAALGVDLEKVSISDKQVILPCPDGRRIVIPVHNAYSPRLGRTVSCMMHVPWFGSSDWRTMYDYPDHLRPQQHYPIGLVWRMAQGRKNARDNNLAIDERLRLFNEFLGDPAVKAFLASPPDPQVIDSRLEITAKVLAAAAEILQQPLAQPPAELSGEEKELVQRYRELQRALAENRIVAERAGDLHRRFAGKSVLIGSIATSAFDFVTTPLHAQCPGVVVHGAIYNAILSGHIWQRLPMWATVLITVGVGAIATIAVALLSPWKAMAATLLLLAGYLTINGLLFDRFDLLAGAAAPTVAAVVVWSFITLLRYMEESKTRRFIQARFSSYADPKLVEFVMANPDKEVFEGREQELTCVFTDMQGFTSLMERLGKGIVPAMNQYMGRMQPIIHKSGGYLNKFLGDGIMFFYGAPLDDPDHAVNAVRTVLEMQETGIPAFNAWLKDQNLDLQVAVRAGVVTGPMVVGDAGSRERADYTVLGDAVNLSSRLESANKYLGTRSMISQRTAELCRHEFLLRPVARIQVVGKSESVTAYEPLARIAQATDEQRALAGATQAIFDRFVAGDFDQCLQLLDEAGKRFGSSKFFDLYAHNCRQFIAQRPDDFDGRIVLTDK